MSQTPNIRVKFVRFAHATASELRSFAALYAGRWALKMIRNFAFACMLLVGIAMAEETDFSKLQPTPEMLREAKKNRGGWVYAISGTYGPNDAVPPEAIAGAWKVDDKGNIIPGSFKPNPNYKKK